MPASPDVISPAASSTAAADGRRGAASPQRLGVLYGLAAYGLWGAFPLYFRAIKSVPSMEVLAHRIIWSALLLLVLIVARRSLRELWRVLRNPATIRRLAITTLLIAGNWLVFIWAIANNHTLQASLGYFINPLVNVLLGFVFLHERLRRWQLVSVLLAATGVLYLAIAAGQPPILSLFLAATFGLYGLLRKTAKVDALHGLTVETLLLTPIALGYLLWQMRIGAAAFGGPSPAISGLLMLAGVITAVPLLMFTAAARALRLATLGFLQYLAPTGHFLCAVLAFGEPFDKHELIAFAFIWVALAIYSVDTVRATPATRTS